MVMLESINSLLHHIKDVQQDVIELSSDSLLRMSGYIEKNGLQVDDDLATALQYQDIITQQLNASIEAIEQIQNSIELFMHTYKNDESMMSESMKKLQERLEHSLAEAKEKKQRFAGKQPHDDDDDGIEFF